MPRFLATLPTIDEEPWLPLPVPRFPPDSGRGRHAYALQQQVGLYGGEIAETKRHLRAHGRWGALVRDGRFADVRRAWEELKRRERGERARWERQERRVMRRDGGGGDDGLAMGARGVVAAVAKHLLRSMRAAGGKRATGPARSIVSSAAFCALP
jgi:hypothetical protein